ncbi:MFS transporter [Xenorhabdus bovienii]|uniref:MFS transporter n=1 Tax=Xenorhabdus bovienii TaxID=40576 RepID=UPI0023B336C0|nr:MFS transporter [Xenorhabdus bovienii]MDE9534759.1 MFS transporter [Xenorhabdus bovienii]MDE9587524.1 MFS transporter [Xenorhabdus bovienii]
MRNLIFIILGNITLESAVPLLFTVGGLAGLHLAPLAWLATLPIAVQMAAGSVCAIPFSNLMAHYSRRTGFILASMAMIFGGLASATAIYSDSFGLLLGGHFLIGISMIGINFLRFAAAESVPKNRAATATSLLLASGIIGVIIGSELYGRGDSLGFELPFIGIYIIVSVIGGCAVLAFAALDGGLRCPINQQTEADVSKASGFSLIATNRRLFFGIATMVLGHAIMLIVMSTASIASIDYGIGSSETGILIGVHLVAMFAPGIITGMLISRMGANRIILLGAILYLVGFLIGLINEAVMVIIAAPLIFAGLGWNFMFLGGTHIINSMPDGINKVRVQGASETLLASVSTVFALASGGIYGALGWKGLIFVVTTMTLLTIALFCIRALLISNVVDQSD